LKKNCKIGSHSVVMPGVTIGENSIVGAFSLVNQDVPDNVIAVGVPAKVIKKIESAPQRNSLRIPPQYDGFHLRGRQGRDYAPEE